LTIWDRFWFVGIFMMLFGGASAIAAGAKSNDTTTCKKPSCDGVFACEDDGA